MSRYDPDDLGPLLEQIKEIAREAAAAILEIYCGDIAVEHKDDASPVTLADAAAEHIIVARLKQLTPEIEIIAEEQAAADGLPAHAPELFWLVDPLDGTKEFIKRNGEFTVNIGLVRHGRPILGVVGLPAKNVLYAACGAGTAHIVEADGERRPITARPCPDCGATVAYSRSHADMAALEDFFAERKVADRVVAGSALKLCLVAEGKADLYPRLGPTMEWDTAAGQAVVEAAGGRVTTRDGGPFEYGKPGFKNPPFVASGR
jgi:3'(2'), 5'-bisphosphate nucleotidase